MSCFWDGLRKAFSFTGNNEQLIDKIKEYCKSTIIKDYKVNGTLLSNQFIDECIEAVNTYDKNSINSGYFCSTCDPMLIIISCIYESTITHHYNGVIIKYEPDNAQIHKIVHSSTSHFWS